MSYCVRCKVMTPELAPQLSQTANGRAMVKSKCSVCKGNKSRFVASNGQTLKTGKPKKKKGKGFGKFLGSVLGSIF